MSTLTSDDAKLQIPDSSTTHFIKPRRKKQIFICNFCKKEFRTRKSISKHIHDCEIRRIDYSIKCDLCDLVFKNKGNLATHLYYRHGSNYATDAENTCKVCDKTFMKNWSLKYHIRQNHFNLRGTVPYCELKKVNQVWFEKVLNTNNILEIKKTGHNTLLMRRLSPNTAIKVNEKNTEKIDLTNMYPYKNKNTKIKCSKCKKIIMRKHLRRHISALGKCFEMNSEEKELR